MRNFIDDKFKVESIADKLNETPQTAQEIEQEKKKKDTEDMKTAQGVFNNNNLFGNSDKAGKVLIDYALDLIAEEHGINQKLNEFKQDFKKRIFNTGGWLGELSGGILYHKNDITFEKYIRDLSKKIIETQLEAHDFDTYQDKDVTSSKGEDKKEEEDTLLSLVKNIGANHHHPHQQ